MPVWPFRTKSPELDEWRKHLTPERRAMFKARGRQTVQFDVSHHIYRDPEKQMAALAWLSGLDERDDLFKALGILVGVGALVIALFTVF